VRLAGLRLRRRWRLHAEAAVKDTMQYATYTAPQPSTRPRTTCAQHAS
jgi:hypothetical protein